MLLFTFIGLGYLFLTIYPGLIGIIDVEVCVGFSRRMDLVFKYILSVCIFLLGIETIDIQRYLCPMIIFVGDSGSCCSCVVCVCMCVCVYVYLCVCLVFWLLCVVVTIFSGPIIWCFVYFSYLYRYLFIQVRKFSSLTS